MTIEVVEYELKVEFIHTGVARRDHLLDRVHPVLWVARLQRGASHAGRGRLLDPSPPAVERLERAIAVALRSEQAVGDRFTFSLDSFADRSPWGIAHSWVA